MESGRRWGDANPQPWIDCTMPLQVQGKEKIMSETRSRPENGLILHVLYSTYYKPMGDLPYISSEQGDGLIIHHGLMMRITIYKRPIPIRAEEGGGLMIRTIRYCPYNVPT